jgi:hypothetical protein
MEGQQLGLVILNPKVGAHKNTDSSRTLQPKSKKAAFSGLF